MGSAGGRKAKAGRRPPCPDGHAGRIYFHGFRKRTDGLYARPRYRCVHSTCDAACRVGCQKAAPHVCGRKCPKPCRGSHTFTGPEQARTHAHPDGLWCVECDRDRSERDGTPVGNEWDFEARLIASALISVGAGASFRQSAETMRMSARRVQRDSRGLAYTSRAGETVARYLDHFGELVLAKVEHQTWPEVLVLDAEPLRRREVKDDDPFSFEQSGNGAILVALGYTEPIARQRRARRSPEDETGSDHPPRPKRLPHLWRVGVAGGYDRWSWFDFLSSLGGTPKWIVVDGDSAVRFAIRKRWGTGPGAPIVFSCEGHLQNKFRERARDQDRMAGAEIWRLWPENRRGSKNKLAGPLWSRDDYRRFLDAVLRIAPGKRVNATSWILNHDETIRRQFDLREQNPGLPRGTGAIEAAILTIRGWLGERTKQFQNVRRLNIVLGLMRAQIAGHADPALYSRVIRDELERWNGRPDLDWRRHHNPWSERKALFALSTKAETKLTAEKRAYLITAQASTVGRKAAEMNLYHLTNGYDPIELNSASTPSVITEGKVVADFPLIAREWDPANKGDPSTTAAGSEDRVGWICALDPAHRWNVPIVNRTGRLTGCGAMRGVAGKNHKAAQPGLARVRAAWGSFDLAPGPDGEPPENELLAPAS